MCSWGVSKLEYDVVTSGAFGEKDRVASFRHRPERSAFRHVNKYPSSVFVPLRAVSEYLRYLQADFENRRTFSSVVHGMKRRGGGVLLFLVGQGFVYLYSAPCL